MALTKVTGQVIKNTTDVTVGVLTVTNTLAVGGTVSIGGTLTYEDVTNIDSVGLITARNGISVSGGDIKVGSATTLSQDNIFTTGIITATSFSGSGTNLTGIDTDLVSDTSPQLGGTLDVNGQYISFPDSNGTTNQARFGTGDDLKIYHQSDSSYILNATGNLNVGSNNAVRIRGGSDAAESMAVFTDNGAVELYYDNTKMFETYSNGVKIHQGANSHLWLNDNANLRLGTGNDIKLYHDGSNSYFLNSTGFLNIKTTGGGAHYIDADDQYFRTSGGENLVNMIGDGAVELYYDNSKKIETTSGGATVTGRLLTDGVYIGDGGNNDTSLSIGASNDLRLYHDGSNSYILERGTGGLYIQSNGNGIFLQKSDGEQIANFVTDAAVELYYNNNKKLETIDDGTKITGYIKATDDGNTVNTGVFHESYTTYNNQHVHWFQHSGSNSAQQYGIRIKSADDGNDVISHIQCSSGTATSFVVRRTGAVESRNNSYGGVSDIKLKENIVDANSQWDDIKNIKVRNFNFKDNPTKKMLGVVAQEIELVSAGLVEDIPDLDQNTNADLGTSTKVVKSSILYMKAIKALQEAQTRIETLETKVAALEGS